MYEIYFLAIVRFMHVSDRLIKMNGAGALFVFFQESVHIFTSTGTHLDDL